MTLTNIAKAWWMLLTLWLMVPILLAKWSWFSKRIELTKILGISTNLSTSTPLQLRRRIQISFGLCHHVSCQCTCICKIMEITEMLSGWTNWPSSTTHDLIMMAISLYFLTLSKTKILFRSVCPQLCGLLCNFSFCIPCGQILICQKLGSYQNIRACWSLDPTFLYLI